jgi:hypothetical protein
VVDRGSRVPDVRWAIAFDQVTAHAVPGSPHLPTLDSLR